jgi:hypothetical protein
VLALEPVRAQVLELLRVAEMAGELFVVAELVL